MSTPSYVDSHKAAGKGQHYDTYYNTDPWHRYLWSWEQQVLTRILREFYAGTDVDLLDFACGTGRIAAVLEDRMRTSTGIDVSDSMLQQAAQKLYKTKLINGNLIANDSLAGQQFNLITAFRFFPNAEPELRTAALHALKPHLRSDGFLVFNNHLNLSAPYNRVARVYVRLRGLKPGHAMSLAECRDLLASAGMELVRIYPVGVLHVPKLNLPEAVYRTADGIAQYFSFMARYSQSPIMVARIRR